MDEPTLDVFAERAASEVDEAPSNADEGSSEGGDDAPEGGDPADEEVRSVAVTYRFSTEPYECALCGEPGREHWAREAGFLCRECVEW